MPQIRNGRTGITNVNAWILVIEDNAANLELVTDVLEASRFRVTPAYTAEEGLRLARELLPDLILMDLSLPGMDGLAAARALKADAVTRHLSIVALTAHAMRGDATLALHAGCDGYLVKPIDTRTFSETIASFVTAAAKRRRTLINE
jgi:CheY-like chemotaxis protein